MDTFWPYRIWAGRCGLNPAFMVVIARNAMQAKRIAEQALGVIEPRAYAMTYVTVREDRCIRYLREAAGELG